MNRNSKYRYLRIFLGGAALYLVSVLPFLIYHGGIFFYYGDYNVQQVPFYILAHRSVRNGYFFWNSHIDLGSSMGESFSFYLWGSPFFWMTVPFPESWIPYMLPFLMALKYGTASLTSYLWIRRQVRTERAAITGAMLYAFSGFQACNIVFQHFHDVTAFFPLFLLAFDDMVQKRKRTAFTLMTALMSVINYYFFFGEVLFLVIYYFVRYAPRQSVKETGREILQILIQGALGLLLAAFFLVQSVAGISGNTRVDDLISGYDIVAYPDATTPLAILKSLFMVPDIIAKPTLFSNDTIRNGSLACYIPCYAVSGVIAFCGTHRHSWKRRLVIICAVMAFIPVLNSMYSALNASYYARWFYMPLLIMCCMTAQAVESGRKAALRKGVGITFVVTSVIMLCALLPVTEDGKTTWGVLTENADLFETEVAATLLQMAVLVFMVYILPRIRVLRPVGSYLTFALTVLCCLITTMSVLSNGNSLIARTGGVKWKQQMLQTKPALSDTETFSRVETDGTSTNYEMVWGYPSIHCFESTVNGSIFTFYRGIGMIRTVESTLPMERVGARAILSVRYYLENTLVKSEESYEDKGGLLGYEEGLPSAGYNIYENEHFIPMGFTFNNYMTETNYDAVTKGTTSDRILVKDLILSDEQKKKYGEFMEEDTDTQQELMDSQEFYDYCDNRAASACSEFSFNRKGFTATADMSRRNLLFFSVPYDEGWTATVDGKEAEIERVDYGLMAVSVPAGTHEIVFTYFPKGLRAGIMISVLTGLYLIVNNVVRLRRTIVLAKKNIA